MNVAVVVRGHVCVCFQEKNAAGSDTTSKDLEHVFLSEIQL